LEFGLWLGYQLYMTETRKTSLKVNDEATQAILNQSLYYREQSPSDGALTARWEDAVTKTIISLLSMPERGAECHFQKLELRGLRRVAVQGFSKHLVFYLYKKDVQLVRIVDVLHSARDLSSLFSDTAL
jgi:plasmid stabilization system protein ParE